MAASLIFWRLEAQVTQAKSTPPVNSQAYLSAPIGGAIVPIEKVPDPVFAEKMMGDGIAIDPIESVLVAPCDGVITNAHPSHHAVTITTDSGLSVLIHIGIDTVLLKGEGFWAKVNKGDRVKEGQTLIEFDLDAVAQKVPTMLTIVAVSEGAENLPFKLQQGVVKAGQQILSCEEIAAPIEVNDHAAEVIQTQHLTIINKAGVHARPAANLAALSKSFAARIFVHKETQKASAKSVVDIMGLELGFDEKIWLSASGEDAKEALNQIKEFIQAGLGEDPNHAPELDHREKAFQSDQENVLGGLAASPGLALGFVWRQKRELPEYQSHSNQPDRELIVFRDALEQAKAQLNSLTSHFEKQQAIEKAQIFAAHNELLDDDQLLAKTLQNIDAGFSAAGAWQAVIDETVSTLEKLKSPLMRQRADDLKDVGYRLMTILLGVRLEKQSVPDNCVLAAEDLTPSDTAYLDTDKVVALLTTGGGASSHAAIIARSMAIPYIAGLGEQMDKLQTGDQVIVNGFEGSVLTQPSKLDILKFEQQRSDLQALNEARLADAHGQALTQDGRFIEVAANIGNGQDADQAVQQGADGIGLLRSEFLFLNRREAPTEQQQTQVMEQIGRALGQERSLVVRTLDVGGDKPLSYMPMAEEENPFLGIRGIRLSLTHPEMFKTQIRATLRAAQFTKLKIMFPMIAQVNEFRRAKAMVMEEIEAMKAQGVTLQNIEIGAMVEVPSAALMAEQLAKEVDFFSIGTNDLTQYCLAMDRGHPQLAAQANALDPAVLKMIQLTVQGAHKHGKWVGVCGGIAAEPLATALLIGLEVDELSVPAPAIPELKAQIRQLNTEECKHLADKALSLSDASSVRTLLRSSSK